MGLQQDEARGTGLRPGPGEAFSCAGTVKTHQVLLASEQRLQLALDCAELGTWEWDLPTNTARWSKRLFEILGVPYSAAPLSADRFFKLVHPDDQRSLTAKVDEAIRLQTELHVEFRIVRPDGRVRWVATRGRIAPGDPSRMFGVTFDITERKTAEAEIRAREDRFRRALDAGQLVTWELNIAKGTVTYSENLERLVGGTDTQPYCSPDALVHQVHPDDRDAFVREIEKVRAGAGTLELEYRVKMLDGKYHWILARGQGDCSHIRGTSIDITERKLLEIEKNTFAKLGHKLGAASSPKEAARLILEAASELIGWDAAYVHLYSRSGDAVLRVLAIDTLDGKPQEIDPATEYIKPTPLLSFVVARGPQLINGTPTDLPVKLTPFGDERRPSLSRMFVPMASQGKPVGVLSIQSYTPDAYASKDLNLLEALADYCGDALQRIQIADALRESERKLRLLAANTNVAIFAFDMDRRPVYANPAVKELTGYTFEEIREKGFINWIHPEDQERMLGLWEGLFNGRGYSEVEFRMITKSGRLKWCSSTWGPFYDENGRQIGVQGREHDITDRRVLEREVLASSTREQRRIGYALHDGLGQVLTGLALKAKTLEDMVAGSEEASALARQMVTLINKSIHQTRTLARGLDPVHIESESFTSALRLLAEESSELLNIRCELVGGAQELVLRPYVAEPLYRIAQEAIHNAARHGNVSTVTLRIELQASDLCLAIEDDGGGFKAPRLLRGGMGLRIMGYRADSIGAELQIRPTEKGTQVCCRVPQSLALPEGRAGSALNAADDIAGGPSTAADSQPSTLNPQPTPGTDRPTGGEDQPTGNAVKRQKKKPFTARSSRKPRIR